MDTLVGIQYIALKEIPSRQDLKVTRETRKIGPPYAGLYAGASVKVLLSQLDDASLKTILDHASIPRATERTVTDKTLLNKQLHEIRRRGYAVSHGERVAGVMSVSAPVKNYFLPVALSVVGPEIRLRDRAARVLLVNCISLLPGTLAATLEGDRVEVHMLDERDNPESQLVRLEQVVARLFGLPREGTDD